MELLDRLLSELEGREDVLVRYRNIFRREIMNYVVRMYPDGSRVLQPLSGLDYLRSASGDLLT